MKHLLSITSSLFDTPGSAGASTELVNRLTDGLLAANPGMRHERLSFADEPVQHLDSQRLLAVRTPAEDRSAEQQQMAAYSDRLIAQLQHADVLVIGAPMYNFSVPSMLKSWVDHVARAGVTFRYTENGAVGLLTGKKVFIAVTSGGLHEAGVTDHSRPWLQTMLGMLGLTDIEFITANGLNLGEQQRHEAMSAARDTVDAIVAAAPAWLSTIGDSPSELARQRGVAA